jgi:hypothetical protein
VVNPAWLLRLPIARCAQSRRATRQGAFGIARCDAQATQHDRGMTGFFGQTSAAAQAGREKPKENVRKEQGLEEAGVLDRSGQTGLAARCIEGEWA